MKNRYFVNTTNQNPISAVHKQKPQKTLLYLLYCLITHVVGDGGGRQKKTQQSGHVHRSETLIRHRSLLQFLTQFYFGCLVASRCFRPIWLLIFLGNFLFCILILQIFLPLLQTFAFGGLRLFDPVSNKVKSVINCARLVVININLLVFRFSIPRFRWQLTLAEKTTVHQLYDEISFLRIGHGDLCDPFRMSLWGGNGCVNIRFEKIDLK